MECLFTNMCLPVPSLCSKQEKIILVSIPILSNQNQQEFSQEVSQITKSLTAPIIYHASLKGSTIGIFTKYRDSNSPFLYIK